MPSKTLCARCGDFGEEGGPCPTCGNAIERRRVLETRGDVAAFVVGAIVGYALILGAAFTSSDGPPSIYQLPGLLVAGSALAVPCGLLSVHFWRSPWEEQGDDEDA